MPGMDYWSAASRPSPRNKRSTSGMGKPTSGRMDKGVISGG